jgi:hypothetical protein
MANDLAELPLAAVAVEGRYTALLGHAHAPAGWLGDQLVRLQARYPQGAATRTAGPIASSPPPSPTARQSSTPTRHDGPSIAAPRRGLSLRPRSPAARSRLCGHVAYLSTGSLANAGGISYYRRAVPTGTVMSNLLTTPISLPEPATTSSVMPCRHSFDLKPQHGSGFALPARCAL